jgi:hypothetical protein
LSLDLATIKVTIDGDASSAVAASAQAQASFDATVASAEAMSAAVQAAYANIAAAAGAAGGGSTAAGGITAVGNASATTTAQVDAYAASAQLAADIDRTWAQTLADIAVAQALVEESTLQVTAAQQLQTEAMAEAATGAGALRNMQRDLADANTASAGSFGGLALAIGATAGAATVLGVQYEASLNKVQAMAGATADQVKIANDALLQLAQTSGQTPDALAKGLYFDYSAGFQGADALNVLTVAAKEASAAQTDMAPVADVLTSALKAYHQPASQAAADMDILQATVTTGKMQFGDLANELGKDLPLAAQFGIGLDQVGASVATMTEKGLNAAEATTAFRSTLQALEEPTARTISSLKAMGLSTADVTAEIRDKGYLGALNDLINRADASGLSLRDLIPNVRGLTGALADMGPGGGQDYLAILAQTSHATGDSAAAFAIYETSVKATFEHIKTDIEVDLIEAFQIAEPQVAAGLQHMTAEAQQMADSVHTIFASVKSDFDSVTGNGAAESLAGRLFGDIGGINGLLGGANPFFGATQIMDGFNTAVDGVTGHVNPAYAAIHTLADGISLLPVVGGTAAAGLNVLSNLFDSSGQKASASAAQVASYVDQVNTKLNEIGKTGGGSAGANSYLFGQLADLQSQQQTLTAEADALKVNTQAWKDKEAELSLVDKEINALNPDVEKLRDAEMQAVPMAAQEAALEIFKALGKSATDATGPVDQLNQTLAINSAAMDQGGLAAARQSAAYTALDGLVKQSLSSTTDATVVNAAYNDALATVAAGTNAVAAKQTALAEVQKDGDAGQKLLAKDTADWLPILQNLTPAEIAAAQAQDELNTAQNAGAQAVSALTIAGEGWAVTLGKIAAGQTALTVGANPPTQQELTNTAKIAANQATIAQWDATIANSSPIDQRIAALQKQLDQELQSGASDATVAGTRKQLAAQMAGDTAGMADAQAVAAQQHNIDQLQLNTAALQALNTSLAAQRTAAGATATAAGTTNLGALLGSAVPANGGTLPPNTPPSNQGGDLASGSNPFGTGSSRFNLGGQKTDSSGDLVSGYLMQGMLSPAAAAVAQTSPSAGDTASSIAAAGIATPDQLAVMLRSVGIPDDAIAIMTAILLAENGGKVTGGSVTGAWGIGQLEPGFGGISDAARTGTDAGSITAQFQAIANGFNEWGGIPGFNASSRGGPWDPYGFQNGNVPGAQYYDAATNESYMGPGKGSYRQYLAQGQQAAADLSNPVPVVIVGGAPDPNAVNPAASNALPPTVEPTTPAINPASSMALPPTAEPDANAVNPASSMALPPTVDPSAPTVNPASSNALPPTVAPDVNAVNPAASNALPPTVSGSPTPVVVVDPSGQPVPTPASGPDASAPEPTPSTAAGGGWHGLHHGWSGGASGAAATPPPSTTNPVPVTVVGPSGQSASVPASPDLTFPGSYGTPGQLPIPDNSGSAAAGLTADQQVFRDQQDAEIKLNTDQATQGRNQADLATFIAAMPAAIESGNQAEIDQLNSLIGELTGAVTAGTTTIHDDQMTLAAAAAKANALAEANIGKQQQENANFQARLNAGTPGQNGFPTAQQQSTVDQQNVSMAQGRAELNAALLYNQMVENQQMDQMIGIMRAVKDNTQSLVDSQGNAAMYLDGGRIASFVGAALVGRVTLLAGGSS